MPIRRLGKRQCGIAQVAPRCRAQRRIVSKARIRLDSRKSVRSFKATICVDISEFESCMPSHAVGLHAVVLGLHARCPATAPALPKGSRTAVALLQTLVRTKCRRGVRCPTWPAGWLSSSPSRTGLDPRIHRKKQFFRISAACRVYGCAFGFRS